MKIIVKHSTIAKAANIAKDMDRLVDTLTGSEVMNGKHYADPVKDFKRFRSSKMLKSFGKAFRCENNPETQETSIELNHKFVEDVLDASHTFTKTLITVAVPLFKVHSVTMENIGKKYKI